MMCDEQTQSTVPSRTPSLAPSIAAKRRPSAPSIDDGVDRGVGAVVDADHRPVRRRELGRLGPDTAADVEHDARPEAQPHLPVARVVEREQRVGRGALHRTLAGEAGHAPGSLTSRAVSHPVPRPVPRPDSLGVAAYDSSTMIRPRRERASRRTRVVSPDHDLQVAKLGDIAGEAGLERVSMLAWRDLDDPEAGGSERHAANIAALWAEAGIEVTMRTSYAANHPR